MDLSSIPLIDVHSHPFPPGQTAVPGELLLQAVTLSLYGDASPLNATTMLSRTLVKELARVLACEPAWDAVVAARNTAAADGAAYHHLLFADANIAMVLIDPGFPTTPTILAADFAPAVPCPVLEGYRIERFAGEDGLAAGSDLSFGDFVEAFDARLDEEARRPTTRFFKSVMAYMTGLAIRKVGVDDARAVWVDRREGGAAEKTLRDHLFWRTALKAREHAIPFQVHTGHTSRDTVWPDVNPILMTAILNEPEMAETSFVLVHGGYPYCTEAGYLTAAYPNVSLDLSLMIPWASIGVARRIEETLEAAPTAKVMYGSDAIYAPELFWLSARIARRALGRVLSRIVDDGVLDHDEAKEVARDILHRNAERIYGVSLAAPA